MNKLLVERQKNYIEEEIPKKSTVSKPNDKEIQKFKNFKNVKNRERIEKDKNKHSSIIKIVAIGFLLGITIMVRYSIIYSNQSQISNIKNEITNVRYNSDELKVQLLKFSDIKKIDEKSKTEFKMIEPKIANIYFYDLSKDNFSDEKDKKSQKKSFIDKIIEYLF